jgi:tRNA/tmRNA/rRNA uracil-C5-methylase (TrmA/RlmC/RlmD family)
MALVDATVGKPAHGGTCVTRIDGRVVFTRHALPAESVRLRVTEGGGASRFWRADAVEVVGRAHSERVPSPCRWFMPGGCAGCSWLHADGQLQARIKHEVLVETLERLGPAGLPCPVGWRAVEPVRGWRTRMTLHTDAGGRAGLHAARSHKIVPVDDCLQADPGLELPELLARTWVAEADIHVSVSEAGRAVVVTRGSSREQVEGPEEHVHTVAGRVYRRAPDGFWQSHCEAPGLLVAEVSRLAAVAPGERVLDLYAGVGLFGLALCASAGSVTLVEGDRRAARFAEANAAGESDVEVRALDVRRWAHDRPRAADVVVIDPPRAGAGKQVVTAVVAASPRAVVYVSCEPSTLARDLAWFAHAGYTADHVEGWDLFPGTAHIETVVRLAPRRPGDRLSSP